MFMPYIVSVANDFCIYKISKKKENATKQTDFILNYVKLAVLFNLHHFI